MTTDDEDIRFAIDPLGNAMCFWCFVRQEEVDPVFAVEEPRDVAAAKAAYQQHAAGVANHTPRIFFSVRGDDGVLHAMEIAE